jgi:hypothetical protein
VKFRPEALGWHFRYPQGAGQIRVESLQHCRIG